MQFHKASVLALVCLCLIAPTLFAATNPVPFLNQPLVPASAAPGSPAFSLALSGTGFVSGSIVQWNGTARATTFVSPTQLTAAILATDIATAGTARITVLNPAPGGGISKVALFQITNPTAAVPFTPSTVTFPTTTSSILGWDIIGQPITADLNGDGKADLIVLNTNRGITVRLGNGDGTFQSAVDYPVVPQTGQYTPPEAIIAGDFNGDGKLDVAVTFGLFTNGIYQNQTAVLFGNGDGTFLPAVISSQSFPVLSTLSAADLNGDGNLDLVGISNGTLCVLLGNGNGTFTTGFTRANFGQVTSIALGDFNGDGKLDVVASDEPTYLFLLLGNGDGTFAAPTLLSNSYARSTGGVVAADFNGDSKLDVAYYHEDCTDISYSSCEGHLDFLLGNGDGTFQPPQTLTGLSLPQNHLPTIVGDFNGDGHADLAFGPYLLLLGTRGTPFSYSLLSIPTNAAQNNVAADFNGDGRLDLIGIEVPVPGQGVISKLNLLTQTTPTGDFSASASPIYQTVTPGSPATYTITLVAIDGFTGTIQPTVAGLPPGATASFNPTTISGSGSTTLTVIPASSTPTGSYQLSVSLTTSLSPGSPNHGGGLTLNVGPSGTDFGDFTGSVSTTYWDVTPGTSAAFGFTIQSLNGFTGNVSLSVSGLPSGVTSSFSPATINGGSGTSTLTVTPAGSTPSGSYPFVVTATSGNKTHSTTLTLNVGPAGSNFADFTGDITPSQQSIPVGGSTTFTISLQPLYTNTETVHITLDPIPNGTGITASGQQDVKLPGSSVITIGATSAATPGTYTLTFRVFGSNSFGSVQHARSVTLTVSPAGGTFVASGYDQAL
jgi:hypothetical protein